MLRSGLVSLWELLVRKSVIKGKKFYSCGLFAFYHGTNFRILFPRHSKVNKDWMRVRRVVISSFPMFMIFFKDFYSIVRSMCIATLEEGLKIKYFFEEIPRQIKIPTRILRSQIRVFQRFKFLSPCWRFFPVICLEFLTCKPSLITESNKGWSHRGSLWIVISGGWNFVVNASYSK